MPSRFFPLCQLYLIAFLLFWQIKAVLFVVCYHAFITNNQGSLNGYLMVKTWSFVSYWIVSLQVDLLTLHYLNADSNRKWTRNHFELVAMIRTGRFVILAPSWINNLPLCGLIAAHHVNALEKTRSGNIPVLRDGGALEVWKGINCCFSTMG